MNILLFAAPRTYTGQDLVEVHTLGSPPLVEALLGHFLHLGARLAQPGEFTLRAFLTGKLDLTQAEAVLAVIEADAPDDLRQALTQLAGGVGQPLQRLRNDLLSLLAEVEAGLDFAEEDLTFIATAELVTRLQADRTLLLDLEKQLDERTVSGRPFRVVLTGLPNAGKSSLFNALLGENTALVSAEAGTTRDYLARRVRWQDVDIELVDTAGESAAEDIIGEQAQSGRREQAEQADLVVRCVAIPEARRLASGLEGLARAERVVWTKGDLVGEAILPASGLATSAVTGMGIDALRQELIAQARGGRRGFVPSLGRCREHVRRAIGHIDEAMGLATPQAGDLLALELRLALDEVGEMVGTICTDELLDRIFSQFCIGK